MLASLPGMDMNSVLPTSHLASESEHILSQMLVRWGWSGGETSLFCKNYRTDMVLHFIPAQYTQHLWKCSFTNRAKCSAGATPLSLWYTKVDLPSPPITFPRQLHMKLDSKEPCQIKDYLKEIKQAPFCMPLKPKFFGKK